MEFWPSDDRTVEDISRKEGKGKKKENTHFNYPNLGHGLVEALTLKKSDKDGRFAWSSLVKNQFAKPRLQASEFVNVFPATRSPAPTLPKLPSHRRVEQGANFLRTHFPDVDVTAELMREEIENDARALAELAEFDPMSGNLIEPIVQYQSLSPRDIYLAFPMGELFCDLNISPFLPGNIFKPSAIPVRTFSTPITQIVSPNLDHTASRREPIFAVRTHSTASVLEMKTAVPFAPTVQELTEISPSDLGGRPIVDLKLPSFANAFVVNDQGVVYTYDLATSESTVVFDYSELGSISEVSSDDFWRIATTGLSSSCLLTSGKVLRHLDTRVDEKFNELFSLHEPSETITAIEGQDGHMIRLCSTSRLLWIDRRFPKKPLLGYQHYRRYDRTLESRTMRLGQDSLTLLTSLKNGMVNVYDVSRTQDHDHLSVNSLPYNLTSAFKADGPMLGQTLLCYPGVNDAFSIFRLFGDGGIQRANCVFPSEDDVSLGTHNWSAHIVKLNEKASKLQPVIGPLGQRDHMEEDFSAVYTRMCKDMLKAEQKEDKKSKAVYELTDHAPDFWQETNMPLEHMLNTYDILFRSGDEPEKSYRSDFLSGSIISSTRGYRAFQKGRLSGDSLSTGAAWHRNINNTLRVFDSTISDDIDEISEHLAQYDLQDPDVPVQAAMREKKAREHLALDLAMSGHIFSPRSFKPTPSVPDDIEAMTEALSIDAEPPPVTFHYLQPVPKAKAAIKEREGGKEEEDMAEDMEAEIEPEEMSCPLGVRLLLKDWDIGTDPELFVYVDPYDNTPGQFEKPVPSKPKTQGLASTTQLKPQAPPTILAASALAAPPPILTTRKGPPIFGSQPIVSSSRAFTQSQVPATIEYSQGSQEPIASTQVLPGPHGGRPLQPKKKPPKKRLGGF
ncbi:hypothetical protein BDZ89DRAFT_1032274 [Hymenopellis radicata]|nr:hypothetical protein BDZ89DRAFT_1032274 [Hymenopellis radicata]